MDGDVLRPTADDVTKALASIEMRGIFTDTDDPSQTIAQSPAFGRTRTALGPAMRRHALRVTR